MINTKVWDILNRVWTGPFCLEKEFLLKKYWPRVNELVKEYGIKYNPETLVSTDTSLMDDVFRAGLNLLLDVGFLCADTSRIIKFEEGEIKEALRNLPAEGTLGEGKDAVTLRPHKLGDKRPPVVIGGPTGGPLSEDMALKIYLSYAKEPSVNVLYVGFLETMDGMAVTANSHLELKAEMQNISLARLATRMCGRSGMPLEGSSCPGQ